MDKKQGFTLIEILITLVIIVGGLLAITRAFSIGIFASSDVENVEVALNIAQKTLEGIYGTTGGVNDVDPPQADADFSDFTVGVQTDDNNPERVDVSVYWDTKGGQVNITLTTLVANY